MKSMFTLMIASLLLASGCASVALSGDTGYTSGHTEDASFMQQLADSSQGA
jgi:uncharacterized protein YceK